MNPYAEFAQAMLAKRDEVRSSDELNEDALSQVAGGKGFRGLLVGAMAGFGVGGIVGGGLPGAILGGLVGAIVGGLA